MPQNLKPVDAILRVSFVIPVYNSAASIALCVASIASQTRVDLISEIILVNDGSTDNSLQELRRLQRLYSNRPVVVEDNITRKYAAFSRNRGIERATGDLICFIDSDIILPPDYVSSHVMQHQADPQCITFSLRSNITDITRLVFPITHAVGDFRDKLLLSQDTLMDEDFAFCATHTLAELCLTCAVTYRRSDLLQVKGCPENFQGWGFNDTAMAAKVIALGRSTVPLYGVTVGHLEHAPRSGNTSKKWAEFAKNKQRYTLMLDLPARQTHEHYIAELEL